MSKAQQAAAPTSIETSVRQLIANGKSRTALENAKEFHKTQRSQASEALLLDAYAARIQSLLDQNLAAEAKSLLDLVCERFPAAKPRLEALKTGASARGGDLAALLQPLNDPELSPDLRAAIEKNIETQITDLAALAACPALPPEHRLRQAAAALDRAFNLVTSGPVTADQIALPEVSHRSPLAPWKLLIRAIACFHRGDDAECRECLAAVNPAAAAARLIPAMRATLGDQPATALKPAEAALIARTSVNLSELRKALEDLDRAFSEHSGEGRIFKTIRSAVAECQRAAADQLPPLKQLIAVRGGVAALDHERLMTALNGAPRRDAAFFRMYACALERSGDAEDLGEACEVWEAFRAEAVREGWFAANGLEAAVLYLHIANLLEKMPPDLLRELQRPVRTARNTEGVESRYFLFPEKLYERACAIDPSAEAFSQWLRWASGRGVYESKRVAEEWHRLRKNDMEPVLFLLEQAEKRNAYPTALAYLQKAERIDPVHSVVRAARLRLLAGGAMRHLQQKKPHLAAEKLAAMEALPQARQGNRPAFLAALRCLILKESGDVAGAGNAHLEAARLLGGDLAARLLIFAIASVSKRPAFPLLPVKALGKAERSEIPAGLTKMVMVCEDLGIEEYSLPLDYIGEAELQFPRVAGSLDIKQLLSLGKVALAVDRTKLAWAASTEGLKRGGSLEAHLMLLRARAMPARHGQRYVAVAAAAAELGRLHGDSDVVGKAIEIVRNPLGGDSISLTLEQARDVVRKEIASPAFPRGAGGDPDYSALMPRRQPCQCPECRAARGEIGGPFDDDDDDFGDVPEGEFESMFNEGLPGDLPPELAKALFGVLKEALTTGESPEQILARIMGGGPGRGKQKKGRRK